MKIAYLFILFIVYSVIGWLSEVLYCSVLSRRLVNRGFLFGPVCPVYGCGGILIIFALQPFATTYLPLFFAGMLVTTVLEYATSFIMEKLFHAKWWDYSDMRFNINGRVCLLNSLMFAAMAVVAVHFVHPFIMTLLGLIPPSAANGVALTLAAVFSFDLAFTLRSLQAFTERLVKLHELTEAVKAHFEHEEWFVAQSIVSMIESVRKRTKAEKAKINATMLEHLEKLELFAEKNRAMLRLVKAFPKLKSEKYGQQLEHLKSYVKSEVARKRERLSEQRRARKNAPTEKAE